MGKKSVNNQDIFIALKQFHLFPSDNVPLEDNTSTQKVSGDVKVTNFNSLIYLKI
jgi:hypothetical protein